VLVASAALLPAAGLAWLVLLSPVLAVDDVQVAGTSRLVPEQVLAAADVDAGTPLARVDAAEIADRVRAQLPPAADVRVRRVWPSTLRLHVTERQPAAGVAREDGVLLVDAAGIGFATEPTLPPGVPSLELAHPGPQDPATRSALAVLAELPVELRGQLAVLRALSASDVEFVLGDGRTVVWGEPGDAVTKAAALEPLLRMEGSVFDVSAPGIAVRR
jgi:cell division protein FtsQ